MTSTESLSMAAASETCGSGAHPQDQVAAIVLQAWSEVLPLEVVHPETSFFDAGGTSIQALQIVRKIRKQLVVELPVSLLFQAGTPAALAALIRSRITDADR